MIIYIWSHSRSISGAFTSVQPAPLVNLRESFGRGCCAQTFQTQAIFYLPFRSNMASFESFDEFLREARGLVHDDPYKVSSTGTVRIRG